MAASSRRSVLVCADAQTARIEAAAILIRLRMASSIEPVAEPANVAEVSRVGGVLFDFAAQVGDVVIYDARAGIGVLAPNAIDEAIAAEHAAARAPEQAEQPEFDGRELDRIAGAADFAA